MRRYAMSVLALLIVAIPCANAQILKKLEQELMSGQQGQGGYMSGQQGQTPAGNTTLPPGQYMMTNLATQQGFYVIVNNNGQMFLSQPPSTGQMQMQGQQMMMPGQQGYMPQQQGGVGGMMKGGLGNFLKKELAPQQQQY